jgi:hypothetical protein
MNSTSTPHSPGSRTATAVNRLRRALGAAVGYRTGRGPAPCTAGGPAVGRTQGLAAGRTSVPATGPARRPRPPVGSGPRTVPR